MACCKRNEEYRCSNCGCGIRITEEPRLGAQRDPSATHCPNCGAPMDMQAGADASGGRGASTSPQGAHSHP